MVVSGISQASRVILRAPAVDDTMRRTHRNLKPAVEKGAESIVACLLHDLTDYVVLEQALDHTGFDYWLADRNDEGPHFQKKVRLEISGILRETSSNAVVHRVSERIERLHRYPDERPAKIAVVEFSAPHTVVQTYG